MPIVSTSDFVGELTIAQLEQSSIDADVNQFIVTYEAEYLNKVLGYTLLTAYNTGLALPTPAPLYVALRDGGTYVDVYGDTVKYNGLKEAIVNYVYFHYIRNNATFTTGSGEKEIQKAQAASSLDKQVRAWNRMVSINKSLRAFIRSNPDYGTVNYAYNEMFVYMNTLGL